MIQGKEVLILAIFMIVVIAVWVLATGQLKHRTHYDLVQEMVDARLGEDSSEIMHHYVRPDTCPHMGNLPSLQALAGLKQTDPLLFRSYAADGTLRRAVNLKAMKEWTRFGKNKAHLRQVMNHIHQIDLERVNLLELAGGISRLVRS